MLNYTCIKILTYLLLWSIFPSEGNIIKIPLKKGSSKVKRIWLRYSTYASPYCIILTNKNNMLHYKKLVKECIYTKFISTKTCRNNKNTLFKIEKLKVNHVCEFNVNGVLRRTRVTTFDNSLTMNETKIFGQECIKAKILNMW